jgi:hypothetical protein
MHRPQDRRLRQLEHIAAPRLRPIYVWQGIEQTVNEALSAHFPDGVPADVRPVVVGWLPPQP